MTFLWTAVTHLYYYYLIKYYTDRELIEDGENILLRIFAEMNSQKIKKCTNPSSKLDNNWL